MPHPHKHACPACRSEWASPVKLTHCPGCGHTPLRPGRP
ncbi:MAG: hypothetical protein QG661_2950 [Actinomycetota bacterium]|jgi:hypothetical protein|nr:hypothetical protein [Actinomycetota bacterium]